LRWRDGGDVGQEMSAVDLRALEIRRGHVRISRSETFDPFYRRHGWVAKRRSAKKKKQTDSLKHPDGNCIHGEIFQIGGVRPTLTLGKSHAQFNIRPVTLANVVPFAFYSQRKVK